jgi:hypothetical protein
MEPRVNKAVATKSFSIEASGMISRRPYSDRFCLNYFLFAIWDRIPVFGEWEIK